MEARSPTHCKTLWLFLWPIKHLCCTRVLLVWQFVPTAETCEVFLRGQGKTHNSSDGWCLTLFVRQKCHSSRYKAWEYTHSRPWENASKALWFRLVDPHYQWTKNHFLWNSGLCCSRTCLSRGIRSYHWHMGYWDFNLWAFNRLSTFHWGKWNCDILKYYQPGLVAEFKFTRWFQFAELWSPALHLRNSYYKSKRKAHTEINVDSQLACTCIWTKSNTASV